MLRSSVVAGRCSCSTCFKVRMAVMMSRALVFSPLATSSCMIFALPSMAWSPSAWVSGSDRRGLSERPGRRETGSTPTVPRSSRPVSAATGETEASPFGKTWWVKAVCPVAAGGCVCNVGGERPRSGAAEEGRGGSPGEVETALASCVGEGAGVSAVACGAALPFEVPSLAGEAPKGRRGCPEAARAALTRSAYDCG